MLDRHQGFIKPSCCDHPVFTAAEIYLVEKLVIVLTTDKYFLSIHERLKLF